MVVDMGWGKDKVQVQILAMDIARCHGHFDFLVSDGWFNSFMDRHEKLTRKLGNNLERCRAGGANVELGNKSMKVIIGDCIAFCEKENTRNGLESPEMCGSDWSDLDEVAFDQGIDKIKIVCRKDRRHNRTVAAERPG